MKIREADRSSVATAVYELCARAAAQIMEIYDGSDPLEVTHKSDASPLTEADQRAHDMIVEGLQKLTPSLPVLSEEHVPPDFEQRRLWSSYWLVDPLDGTREFIDRTGEFTVNVALIEQGVAVLGVVYLPLTNVAYIGIAASPGLSALAEKVSPEGSEALGVSELQRSSALRVLTSSRSHGEQLLACLDKLKSQFASIEWLQAGSALKFCRLAEGAADLYPRFTPCCEWDTAAGQVVLEAAGGCLVDVDFKPLRYNQQKSLISPSFYAFGASMAEWQKLLT